MKPERVFRRLTLGENYIVSYLGKSRKICKFIKTTPCGYNFLNLDNNKCILKRHLYPSKYEKYSSGDWFSVNICMGLEKI